ncbi:MAG: thermonuclease family protein [Thiotrichaceae bacterium]|nr:thermonuclease family protein [Thiotrichaceae bacterium]
MAADSKKRVPDSGTLFSFVVMAFALVLVVFSPFSVAGECGAEKIDAYFTVKYVHDGDTLHLVGGKKVRLIGINTPEVARDKKPAEPYANAARDVLKKLFKADSRVGVQYGHERKDRYGRTLAHLYLADGSSVQQRLLDKGLAMAIAIPPNLHSVDCYQQSERLARIKRQGLWQDGGPEVLDAASLRGGDQGFTRLKGRVDKVTWHKKWIWISFSDKASLRISRDDAHYFEKGLLASLAQKKVEARGWLTQRKGRWSIRVRHPSSLSVVGD